MGRKTVGTSDPGSPLQRTAAAVAMQAAKVTTYVNMLKRKLQAEGIEGTRREDGSRPPFDVCDTRQENGLETAVDGRVALGQGG